MLRERSLQQLEPHSGVQEHGHGEVQTSDGREEGDQITDQLVPYWNWLFLGHEYTPLLFKYKVVRCFLQSPAG